MTPILDDSGRPDPARRKFLQKLAASSTLATGWPQTVMALSGAPEADVVFLEASHKDFARHREIFNKRITVTPAVIAVCSSESGVRKAVIQARSRGLPIAIKSGGHSFEGFSLNEGGMVIDLSLMDKLELLAGYRLRADPGCRLAQVYDFLLPRSRLLPAGSCGGVGLAGLTLGGGYGMFSRKFGLTCDNLMRVRLVDGRGALHDSRDEPEILWACRGGGNAGLGVVIQLQYTTHPAPNSLHSFRYRYRIGTAEDAVAVAAKWFSLMQDLPAEAYSALVANGNTVTILVATFLPGARNGLIAALLAKLAANATKVEPPVGQPLAAAARRYYGQKGPIFFKNASGGFYQGWNDIRSAAPALFEAVLEQPGIIFQVNTFGPLPDAPNSAFPHREFAFIGELQAYWQEPSQGERRMATISRLQNLLTQHGIRAHYANYPDIEIKDWAEAYYGPRNYPRLQAVKRRLDPDDVFRHPQSIQLPA